MPTPRGIIAVACIIACTPIAATAAVPQRGANTPAWPVADTEVQLPLGAHESFDAGTWSPDGRHIAFIEPGSAPLTAAVWIVDGERGADGSERMLCRVPLTGITGDLMWPAPGDYIYVVRNRDPERSVHGALYRVRVSDGAVGEVVRWPHTRVVWAAAASPDGRRVVLDFDGSLVVVDVPSKKMSTVHRWVPHGSGGLTWSPNGKTIAFGRNGYVCTIAPNGKTLRTICRGGYTCWSPDGRWIVFTRETDEGRAPGGQKINPHTTAYVIRPDGTGEHRLAPNVTDDQMNPMWSPQGNRILYRRFEMRIGPVPTRWWMAALRA